MTTLIDLPEALYSLLAGRDSSSRRSGLPWITLSYAQSLDGSIAARRGERLELSGPSTLKITHQLRAMHQAILVGIGTLLADNPRLNVRLIPGDDPQPVVLDNQLRFSLDARLLQGSKPPWIITASHAPAQREALLVQAGACVFRTIAEKVELAEALSILGREGIRSVMVEGGARVITSFLRAKLVDLIVLTIAPRFVGGLRAVEDLLAEDGLRLDKFGVQRYENDLLVWGRPCWDVEDQA